MMNCCFESLGLIEIFFWREGWWTILEKVISEFRKWKIPLNSSLKNHQKRPEISISNLWKQDFQMHLKLQEKAELLAKSDKIDKKLTLKVVKLNLKIKEMERRLKVYIRYKWCRTRIIERIRNMWTVGPGKTDCAKPNISFLYSCMSVNMLLNNW